MYQNKSIKLAVLFDMDGVLIDSNAVIERAWCEAAKMYGREISDEDIIKHIGDTVEIVDRIKPVYNFKSSRI